MVSTNTQRFDVRSERRDAWKIEHRPESGTYVCTRTGVLLFRVSDGMVHFWDRRQHAEISICIDDIVELTG